MRVNSFGCKGTVQAIRNAVSAAHALLVRVAAVSLSAIVIVVPADVGGRLDGVTAERVGGLHGRRGEGWQDGEEDG